ncbi:MAG: aminoacyl-tRNA hydrolase [Lachnospiraceae bacterium]
MFIIAGLGNPTSQYEGTRHNIGFDVMDALAEKYNISISEKKHKALCGKGVIEGEKVLLVKPQTYMNLSGESIAEILNYYKLDAEEDFLVVFDDISLAPGNIRIRKKGSAGGHNGIKNIIAMTGTQNFKRIKVGVGEKPKGWDLADYVLGRFSDEDRKKVNDAIEDAIGAVSMILRGETDQAMNCYNAKKGSIRK